MKFYALGFFLTIFLWNLGFIQASHPDFFSRVSREVDRALRRREGVVLWFDRQTGERLIWGNPELAKQKFRPGSLFKILLAEEALAEGLKPSYRCAGHDILGGKRHTCWSRKGHGDLDLPRALAESCNLFFSSLGLELGARGLGNLLERHQEFVTVIARSEAVPRNEVTRELFATRSLALWARDDRNAVRLLRFARNDRVNTFNNLSEDELIALSIGDSPYLRVSPEGMAGFWERFLTDLEAPDHAAIKEGLRRAVEEGTASRAGVGGLALLGKTGTADSERESYKTDAWFLGAYPAEHPRYGLVIFLKEAYGFREPSELAGRIFSIAKDIYGNQM